MIAGGAPVMSDRRHFFRAFAREVTKLGVSAGLLGGFVALRRGQAPVAGVRPDLGIVRPPGSLEEPDFLARCIRCTRCADACEAQCIRLFGAEAGDLYGTPHIVPEDKACTLCLACTATCPTEAIVPLTSAEQAMTPPAKMGVAVVDERLCVSHAGTGICGACHTICPFRNRAITQSFRNAPTVHAEFCTGCGLCEEVCIVKDRRAIRVVSERRAGQEA